jgi:hypothetical protein
MGPVREEEPERIKREVNLEESCTVVCRVLSPRHSRC